eukprot:6497600-Prymnesium_polylepis.1
MPPPRRPTAPPRRRTAPIRRPTATSSFATRPSRFPRPSCHPPRLFHLLCPRDAGAACDAGAAAAHAHQGGAVRPPGVDDPYAGGSTPGLALPVL